MICFVDYNFENLGARMFEKLTQALAVRTLGPRVSTFGDGPDGGREASWQGDAASLGELANWNGYGILQAKHKQFASDVAQNLTWIKQEIRKEMRAWTTDSRRTGSLPDFYLLATNIRLSSTAGGGKDTARQFLVDEANAAGLDLKDVRIWDYWDLCALLDDSESIRRGYAAWTTPGDVLTRLLNTQEKSEEDFARALERHAAKTLARDNILKLSQAGTAKDQPLGISDLFIDLPVSGPGNYAHFTSSPSKSSQGILERVLAAFDSIASDTESRDRTNTRALIVGGPGQGKSTVTQFLAQIYRAEFLTGTSTGDTQDIRSLQRNLSSRLATIAIRKPTGRRWPIRILLTELADALAKDTAEGILDFIAQEVSRNALTEVSGSQMGSWLASYPWVVILDGLDEVPNSSNRDQIMASLRDFFIDAESVKADFTVIATTRPQGYADEFGSFNRYDLTPLPRAKALSYAETFLSVRNGPGSQVTSRTQKLLVEAIDEASTARLFESPLQVTILAILIERLGHAPRDRWRLFSSYYQVITQREQEKGGDLAVLLQRYASDVDFIHRWVGNLLQERSGDSGETSASVSREEFAAIISQRLRDLENTSEDVVHLTHEFMRLATERLVFLAMLTSDRVGFEIRSLQEFMAAEYIIMDLPEVEIVPQLRRYAPRPHWRNVVLFAAGRIFAERDRLKGEITNMCADLDLDNYASGVIRPGAELALDILRDGSCSTQPRYAKPLAERAAMLLDQPLSPRLTDLSSLTEGEVGRIIEDKVEGAVTSGSKALNSLSIFLARVEKGDESAQASIDDLVSTAEASLRLQILSYAWARDNIKLNTSIEPIVGEANPLDFFNLRRSTDFDIDGPDDDVAPTSSWSALGTLMQDQNRDIDSTTLIDDHSVQLLSWSFTPIQANKQAWSFILEANHASQGWNFLSSVARFVMSPSQETLSACLDLAACLDQAPLNHVSYPWPLRAALELGEHLGTRLKNDNQQSAYLTKLAVDTRNGLLGDETDWFSAEMTAHGSNRGLTSHLPEPGPSQVTGPCPLPFDRASLKRGFPANACSYGMRHPNDRQEREDGVHDALHLLSRGKSGDLASVRSRSLGIFMAGVIGRLTIRGEDYLIEPETQDTSTVPDATFSDQSASLVDAIEAYLSEENVDDGTVLWGDFLGLVQRNTSPARLSRSVLEKVGARRRILLSEDAELARWIVLTHSPLSWQAARVALLLDPSLTFADDLQVLETQSTNAVASEVLALTAVGKMTVDEVEQGHADDYLSVLIRSRDESDSQVLAILSAAIKSDSGSLGTAVACRASLLTAQDYPHDAAEFIERAKAKLYA